MVTKVYIYYYFFIIEGGIDTNLSRITSKKRGVKILIEHSNKNSNKFNLLILEADKSEMDRVKSAYQVAANKVNLEGRVLGGIRIDISTANNEPDVKKTVKAHVGRDPKSFQIFHLPEQIYGRSGINIMEDLRREFEYQNLGAILALNEKREVSPEFREKGIYSCIDRPVTAEKVTGHLQEVLGMVLLKSKPEKKSIDDVFLFRPLLDEKDYFEYYRRRFEIWDKLNYIPQEFRSESFLEIDDYDKFSIPLGGFSLQNEERLAIISRIITSKLQMQQDKITRRLVKKFGDKILHDAFEKLPTTVLPVIESCRRIGKEDNLMQFINMHGGLEHSVEYSRMMVTDERIRGAGLSKYMALFHNFYAKEFLGTNLGIAECLSSHVDHNTKSSGFTGEIPKIGTIDAVRVEQVAKVIYIDLKNNNNSAQKRMENIQKVYSKYGFFCACSRMDCMDNGYMLDKSKECTRKVLGYDC